MEKNGNYHTVINFIKNNTIKKITWGAICYGWNRFSLFVENIQSKTFIVERNKEEVRLLSNGSLLIINSEMDGIHKELLKNPIREPFSTNFIIGHLKPDDVVIEIGANIGYYALLESRICKNGHIHAFEPIKSNMNNFIKNIEINSYQNISTYQIAVGNKSDDCLITEYDKPNWSGFNQNLGANIVDKYYVKMIKLDDFLSNNPKIRPTFIRMDVEGFECEIIEGGLIFLQNSNNLKMFIEFHPQLVTKEKMMLLLDRIYQCGFIIDAIFIEPPSHININLKISNYLFNKIGLDPFGYIGKSQEVLLNCINKQQCCQVFFNKS